MIGSSTVLSALGVSEISVPGTPLAFRFGVMFFRQGIEPNVADIRFQKVRGLSTEIETTVLREGGQNLCTHRLPTGISHSNLVLERGVVIGSPLVMDVNETFSLFRFTPANVMITLFSETSIPLMAWLVLGAYPVKWSTSDLDATQKSLLIDTFELTYSRMQTLRI